MRFQVLLPVLIFESAVKINSHLFFRKLKLLVALTGIVYCLTMILHAALILPWVRVLDNWDVYTVCLLIKHNTIILISSIKGASWS